MSRNILIGIGVVILLGIGGFVLLQNSNNSTSHSAQDVMVKEDESMMKDEEKIDQTDSDSMMKNRYTGELLAGNKSPYLVFNTTDYDKARAEGKIVFLDFYANWCPICRVEAPEIKAAFDSLTKDNVVGFRVNFNDTDTDEAEKALAKEFGVTYQHTKVILKDGKQVFKSGDQWDTAMTVEEINKFVQ